MILSSSLPAHSRRSEWLAPACPKPEVQITIAATAGKLRLRGIVDTDAERRACADVAHRVAGVTEVTNELKVMRRS